MYDYESKIETYKRQYIFDKGERKYNKIVAKVKNSKTLTSALNQSVNNNHPLLEGDFKIISDSALTFLSGPTTGIMGQLIAFQEWQSRCNRKFTFFNEYELSNLVSKMIGSYGKMGKQRAIPSNKNSTEITPVKKQIDMLEEIIELNDEIRTLQAESSEKWVENRKKERAEKKAQKEKIEKERQWRREWEENKLKGNEIKKKKNEIKNKRIKEKLDELNSIYKLSSYCNLFNFNFSFRSITLQLEGSTLTFNSVIDDDKSIHGPFGFIDRRLRYTDSSFKVFTFPYQLLFSSKNSKGIRFKDLMFPEDSGDSEHIDIVVPLKLEIISVEDVKNSDGIAVYPIWCYQAFQERRDKMKEDEDWRTIYEDNFFLDSLPGGKIMDRFKDQEPIKSLVIDFCIDEYNADPAFVAHQLSLKNFT